MFVIVNVIHFSADLTMATAAALIAVMAAERTELEMENVMKFAIIKYVIEMAETAINKSAYKGVYVIFRLAIENAIMFAMFRHVVLTKMIVTFDIALRIVRQIK